MVQPRHALIRTLPRSYREYYAAHGVTIDLIRADQQHAAYTAALADAGLELTTVRTAEGLPDCVFIEDTAVVWGHRALVTRMVPRREGEQADVIEHLATTHDIVTLPDGARLEGGDVLHAGPVTYVGLTQRTNMDGVHALRAFLSSFERDVVPVPCDHCLHLKTAATWLGDDTLLAAPGFIDTTLFANASDVIHTAQDEAHAANTIRVHNHLIIQAGYPHTERVLRAFGDARGLTVTALDTSEFAKGDGSLTCLSIIA